MQHRRLFALALVARLATASACAGAGPPVVAPVDRELRGPGQNLDDPCFWVDPNDPAGTLAFVTAKDSGFVEVFNLVSGALVALIPGFERPNNCAVEGDLLLTTDRTARLVRVHHLPDFVLLRTFGADMVEPDGIDVLGGGDGPPLVYVTDRSDSSVHVYALDTGALVRTFPTGFGTGIESILIDDRYQRVFLVRGEKEALRGFGWFTPEGKPVREVGGGIFDQDAEGMALYACGDGGYLVAVDQLRGGTEFEVFDRVTLDHLGTFRLGDGGDDLTDSTDGIDILQTPLPGFPYGVLAACDGCASSESELDVVAWEKVAAVMGLALCPDGRDPDCVADPCPARVVAAADTFVSRTAPHTNLGREPVLEAESDPPRKFARALFRFAVPAYPGFDLEGAALRLTVSGRNGSDSDSGGVLFASAGDWDETTVTFATRPRRVGRPIARAGRVTDRQTVDFDVSRALNGAGTYEFMLRTASDNKVRYRSREAGESPPTLLLRLREHDPSRLLGLEAAADGYVASASPERSFGARKVLRARRGRSEMQSFLRFAVSGTDGRVIEHALLRLSLDPGRGTGSAVALHSVADAAWQEGTLSYSTRPAVGDPLAGAAPVERGDRVEFDVTAAVHGDGPVAFALVAVSRGAISYRSREAASGRPELLLVFAPAGPPPATSAVPRPPG